MTTSAIRDTPHWEIRIRAASFTRWAKKVKALGGYYSTCRGNTETRIVKVPATVEGESLMDEILISQPKTKRMGSRSTVIARNIIKAVGVTGNTISAWTMPACVTVHDVVCSQEARVKVAKAADRAVEQGVFKEWSF